MTVDDRPRAVPAFIDNLAVVYNKKIFDDAGRRLSDRRLDLGRLPGHGGGAQRPRRRDRRLRLARNRRRGHHLADLAAGLAAGRRDRQRGRQERRLRRAERRGGARGRRAGGLRRLGLHRQHRRQRAHAAAVRQRQDGDERRRPVLAARVRRRQGRLRGRLDAVVRRRAHDDRRPRHLGDLRQRRRALGRGDRVHGLVQPARAAAALDQRGRQPAADQRRQGRRRVTRTTRRACRASTSSSRTPTLARTRATIPEYPQISQAMGKAVASVLYGEADPSEALSQAVETANAELQVPGP